MKKQDLLRIIDNELLEELFGFCYTRTKDSYEAEELCSDIVFALIKAACSNGEIENLYPFIWKVARNVYADFSDRRRKHTDMFYIDNGKYFGSGWDGVNAENVCGYSKIRVDNIYTTQVRAHFHCGLNLANDIPIQLALRAIDGLNIGSLTEAEKECAAMAVSCGYLYREGEMLYTKILVNRLCDSEKLYDISQRLEKGCFEKTARIIADKMAKLIYDCVPDYLLSEWKFANRLVSLPVIDSVVEALIEKGMLVPPEDGVGAEGCWMGVEK